MRDQKKAEEITAERVQLLSPLLANNLDTAQARQIKARICEQTGISERTLRRYLSQYKVEGCTHCLLFGSQNGKRIIDDHMVKLVIQGELT